MRFPSLTVRRPHIGQLRSLLTPTARPPFQAPIPTDSPASTLIRIPSQGPQLRDPFLQRRRGNDDESFLVVARCGLSSLIIIGEKGFEAVPRWDIASRLLF